MGLRALTKLWWSAHFSLALGMQACSCSRMGGEVDSFAFVRCAEHAAPSERTSKLAGLELQIEERTLTLRGSGELRVAAFTGPVGGAFSRTDLARLADTKPSVLLYLGGLGDTLEIASANLTALAGLRVPTLFIPGGADQLELVDAAFEHLDDQSAEFMVHGSGLRELRLNKERFAILPGAALGRYARDERSCGFEQADLDALEEALGRSDKEHTWLLGWNAPAGWGITRTAGQGDVGSPELAKLAQAIGARGGIFAYPEVQAMQPAPGPKPSGLAMVVPRLGRTGALRADGGRLPPAVATLRVTANGLSAAP
ncbi:MAG: hypothetical protein QM778_09390 [Myxococcales bacterium]